MSSPLAPIGSIKVKLGLLVTASVLVAALVGVLATYSGVPALLAIPVTVALALGVTQLLAVGMTSPLREMTGATQRMAAGDYGVRVNADSSDEVGELARAFNQMAAELATVDQEQRELIATVSHELRTPLTALTAVLENMADAVVPADATALDSAVAQAQRVGALVTDLLELSRLEAGVARLRLAPVALADLVGQLATELMASAHGVRFDVDVPESLVVHADPTRLRQLLTNVLDNAARHSPDGGVVQVRGHATADRWRLDVIDSGPGVAPADRERAFERFGTLASSSDATGGTGLGLAIARWVAALHGGTVRFVDPPQGTGGADLRIDLPRQPPAHPSELQQEVIVATRPTAPEPAAPAPQPIPASPVLEPTFDRHWPDVPGSGRPVVLAGAGVGVLGGLVLVDRPLGLALFVVLAGAGCTVAAVARHRRDPFTAACLGLAALCTLPVLLLDAAWIGVLCVLAGATVLVAGLTRARRLQEFVLAGLAWPLAGLRGLPWFGRSVRGAPGQGDASRIAATAVWSLLALLVFGLLFTSADAIVANWFDVVLPDVRVDTVVSRLFLAVAITGATLAAAYLGLNPPAVDFLGSSRIRPAAHRFEWLVPVLLVDAVFAVFVAAQLTALFGGHDYVQRTTGLTYAEYSHQGFGQLTIATLLTLLVVWAAARRSDPADRMWLRVSLGLLCALTLVVVGSALHRMHLYQQAYGFTRLRLLVDVFEGWLGLVVVAVAVAGLVRWGAWLSRFALVTGAVALLGLAAINPDAWIARHNLDRYADTGRVDWSYLRTLSADAVPVFSDRSETEALCGTPRYWSREGDWLSWNLGRSRAEGLVAEDSPAALPPPDQCPSDAAERAAADPGP
jgi:two-component system sensor histidine kinase BaeS